MISVLAAMAVCTVLGMVIERTAYKPLRQALPGRADHGHRHELPASKRRPARLGRQPQELPSVVSLGLDFAP